MKKRNDNFNLSGEDVVSEFMKAYDSHSGHRRHSSHHHSDKKDNEESSSKHHKHHSRKKKLPLVFKIIIIIVAILFFLAILGASSVLFMRYKGMNEINKNKEDVTIQTIDDAVSYDDSGKTVEYKGQKYVYNENIVTAVFLGIDDKSSGVTLTDEYGTAGQADTIMVLAYDTESGEASVITVPRDAMVAVDVYSASGDFARTEKMQICLSFAYGDGGKLSCENVITSIERVLLGIPIDSYFSLRIKGVDALNNAVGGIELTSLETIGQFIKGEKTKLWGSAARFYVTSRDRAKIDSDSLRRERQIQYIKAFASKTISLAKDDIGIITTLYNTAKRYSVTDVTLSNAVYLAGELITNSAKINKVTSLKGEYVETDSYPQFILDNELVYETILEVFYEKVN